MSVESLVEPGPVALLEPSALLDPTSLLDPASLVDPSARLDPSARTKVTSTVVICAYTLDRWDDLVDSVRSAAGQSTQPDQVLVVIDHNDELLARSTAEFAGIATVIANTAKKGLSGGRNTAIESATGDVVVFLDDDASAEPGWLTALLSHYDDPTVVGVGGVAQPRFPSARPTMLPAAVADGRGELDWVVGCTYTGQPDSTADVRNLMGCNMSLRRSVFSTVGGFSEGLGRIGKTPLGCEETELCIRATQRDAGARIVFEPAAVVRHRVSADRVTWKYLFARCFAEGVSKAAVARMVGKGAALESEKSYASKVLPKAVGRELLRGVRGHGSSFAGAGAVVLGLACTTAGYARGSIARRPADAVPAPVINTLAS